MFDNGLLNALELLVPKCILATIYHEDFFLYFTAFLGVVMPSCVYFLYQYIYGIYAGKAQELQEKRRKIKLQRSAVTVFHALNNEAEESLPFLVANRFPTENPPLINLAEVKKDKFLKFQGIGLFIISTTNNGHEPADCEWFFDWLEELIASCSSHSKKRRCRMRFAIFGYGDSGDGSFRYNRVSKILAKRLHTLGASQVIPLYSVDKRKKQNMEEHVDLWIEHLLEKMERSSVNSSSSDYSLSSDTLTSTSTDTVSE